MSLNVTFGLGSFPAGFCWQNPQQYAAALLQILTGTIAGTFSGVSFGDAPPADLGSPWARTTGGGQYLDGIYVYTGGRWMRPHPVPPLDQQVIIWKGKEEELWAYDGGDGTDPSGPGTAPTLVSGAMWIRDTDFDLRFPLGIGTSATIYPPETTELTVGEGDTGGEERHALTVHPVTGDSENAPHTHFIMTNTAPVVDTTSVNANNHATYQTINTGGSTADYHTGGSATAPTFGITSVEGGDPNNSNSAIAHNNMPPYRGVIYAKRSLRKYYTV